MFCRAEPGEDLFAQRGGGLGCVQRDDGFFGLRPLQCGELAGEQTGRHVVAGPGGEPAQQLVTVGVHEHESRWSWDYLPQEIAIGFSQGRATGHRHPVATDGASKVIQPGPAIVIRQRDTGVHLGARFGGVEVVAFQKRALERAGERCAERRLATAGYSHHDQSQWTYGA